MLASTGREIRRPPVLPPARRRRPHPRSSPGPCATSPPMLPLPWLCARLKCERQPRRGSRCVLECPMFRVRPALLPTAAPPVPRLPLLQPRRQIPPRFSALAGSVRSPMRGRGFLCRDQQPCQERLGAGPSTPGCLSRQREQLLTIRTPSSSHSEERSLRWISRAASRASRAIGKAAQNASPTVLKT